MGWPQKRWLLTYTGHREREWFPEKLKHKKKRKATHKAKMNNRGEEERKATGK